LRCFHSRPADGLFSPKQQHQDAPAADVPTAQSVGLIFAQRNRCKQPDLFTVFTAPAGLILTLNCGSCNTAPTSLPQPRRTRRILTGHRSSNRMRHDAGFHSPTALDLFSPLSRYNGRRSLAPFPQPRSTGLIQ